MSRVAPGASSAPPSCAALAAADARGVALGAWRLRRAGLSPALAARAPRAPPASGLCVVLEAALDVDRGHAECGWLWAVRTPRVWTPAVPEHRVLRAWQGLAVAERGSSRPCLNSGASALGLLDGPEVGFPLNRLSAVCSGPQGPATPGPEMPLSPEPHAPAAALLSPVPGRGSHWPGQPVQPRGARAFSLPGDTCSGEQWASSPPVRRGEEAKHAQGGQRCREPRSHAPSTPVHPTSHLCLWGPQREKL